MTTPRNTYLRIADTLRTAINNGEYTDRLPTVDHLMSIHGVGRGVITRALHLLKNEGLTTPKVGTGWFVATAEDSHPLDVRIRRMLIDEGYQRGDAFPTLAQLRSRFGVSDISIFKVIARLEGEQILTGREGRRNYIRTIPLSEERP